MEESVREALRTVNDPELGINVVDLGLVCGIRVSEGEVAVDLTLTSPFCPLGPWIADQAKAAVEAKLPGFRASVRLVKEPRWTPDRMNEQARKLLGK